MPKSSSPKKTGAPKQKGAVRAKSGCYTCRIRRKKCDEKPDEQGRCETCVRLRLQCLGFGAKRPDWLRENNNVLDLREKIKNFLASQGMIKGHSGSASRNGEQEQQPTLHLGAPSTNDSYSASSQSPASNTLTLDPDAPRNITSSVRDELYTTSYTPVAGTSSSMYDPSVLDTSSHSQTLFYRPEYSDESHQPGVLISTPSYSSFLTSNHTNLVVPWTSPAHHSSFGDSYTALLSPDSYDEPFDDMSLNADATTFDSLLRAGHGLVPDHLDGLLNHYLTTVYRLQYQLADMTQLPSIILPTIRDGGGTAADAARLLATIHYQKSQGSPASLTSDGIEGPARRTYGELVQSFSIPRRYTDKDAMAALHIISAFLFDGGKGNWEFWMKIGHMYCLSILSNASRFRGSRDALISCSQQENFIIKTMFWFDVLSAVTTMEAPSFYNVIDEIYDPTEHSGIHDPDDMFAEPQLSMMKVMGCEKHILWALSEISSLAAWKDHMLSRGMLSVPTLVSRATKIEQILETQQQETERNYQMQNLSPLEAQEATSRNLTSEIFRTAAIVYLRTVVSGDYPHVQEIRDAVKACVDAFRVFKDHTAEVRHVVVRSTVFAVFMCGCLTDVPEDWNVLATHLKDEGDVGNCQDILTLMKNVKQERAEGHAQPVHWRQALKREKMLLV